ncbi:MAG TPA: 4-hydroxy-tetrahydrodipicolinate reductase [Candidatus Limosilactobacillus merdigallinarum]|uniref:4-hydroxy-tetrahydrodipicolinate reductase n=1 Tax=Candidatus Limosilactobacillus merdigallinarum TaxID=2838652 RepID=A0A9D2ALQ3_9LACO|nr:4-hydroxy-tetrahydrodipicolinate reductase [Candidatus Limosilactobacillus merdigallinarum]
MKRVLIAGINGAMGQKVVNLVNHTDGFIVSAGLGPNIHDGQQEELNVSDDVKLYASLDTIDDDPADIWIDFTVPQAVYPNVKYALTHGIKPIVGTTGLTDDQEAELKQLADDNGLGGLIAPNFGMSAVLLMKFAKEAAAYFPDVEIIEMHHSDKKDAPSGTALSTAKLIAENRKPHESAPDTLETMKNVRGGDYQGIRIHAVRLPGYIAHEQVLFGGKGEALTIRQDSFDRESFMSGVKVAMQKIDQLDKLYIGLENIL